MFDYRPAHERFRKTVSLLRVCLPTTRHIPSPYRYNQFLALPLNLCFGRCSPALPVALPSLRLHLRVGQVIEVHPLDYKVLFADLGLNHLQVSQELSDSHWFGSQSFGVGHGPALPDSGGCRDVKTASGPGAGRHIISKGKLPFGYQCQSTC